MKQRKRTIIPALVVLLIPLFAVSTGGIESIERGGTLIVGMGTDVKTLNGALTKDAATIIVTTNIYNSLVDHEIGTFAAKPELAESWEISEDGLTYTFHLRRDVKWHDGEPFTSADVKFTFEDVLIPYHPAGKTVFYYIDSVDTPDDYTVVFKLNQKLPFFMACLGNTYAPIIAKHLYEDTDILENPFNSQPVGTGPFKFDEWVRSSHIKLKRNENYFRNGLPYLDEVIFKVIPEGITRLLALETGEIDYIEGYFTTFTDFPLIKGHPELNYTISPAIMPIGQILFNLRNPITSNVKVRHAINHCLNRTYIVETVFFGLGNPIYGPFPSGYASYYDPDVPKDELDYDKANSLLDEAGYERGPDGIRFELSISYQAVRDYEAKVAEILREWLKEVGIILNLEPLEKATLWEKAHSKWDFDMTQVGFGLDPDPCPAIGRLYVSSNIIPGVGKNAMGYNNSQVDKLFSMAAEELNETLRTEYFHEIQEIIVEDLPSLFVWEYLEVN